MKLIFEKGMEGRGLSLLPESDVPEIKPSEQFARKAELHLPQVSETELSRHYTQLIKTNLWS